MPITVIHLEAEHKAAIYHHWIRLTLEPHGWSIEGTLPDTLYLGPSKCGYAPDRITAEDVAISAAHQQGATLVYVEG